MGRKNGIALSIMVGFARDRYFARLTRLAEAAMEAYNELRQRAITF